MFSRICCSWLLMLSLLWVGPVAAKTEAPIVISAVVTATGIEFFPNPIPENTPFIIHVINKTSAPIELENSDTSVEIYANGDKTFKIGLAAGSYIFFNDFNNHVKPATLLVKTAVELKNANPAKTMPTAATPAHSVAANLNYSEILFIVWRESVEALLVVGVIYSWLAQSKTKQGSGFLFLGLGIVCGLLCAILLSFMLITASHILSPTAATLFQAGMTLIAAGMIVYMVKWMRRNGKVLKSNMYQSLDKNSSTRYRNIAIFTVASVAIAREASEASIFIYALGFSHSGDCSVTMIGILALGVLLAIATIFLLQLGNKIFSWRFFFKITEILLLLLGGGLVLSCIDQLILSGYLPALYNRFWDTSFLISNQSVISPLLTSFVGYRPAPSLMDILVYCSYWIVVYFLLNTKKVPGYAAKS
ncbi:MAG: FTR1 family protein [Proteobacteria bacterium]|nr:FTR1 family protein [Pseudomonadota bacterium]